MKDKCSSVQMNWFTVSEVKEHSNLYDLNIFNMQVEK